MRGKKAVLLAETSAVEEEICSALEKEHVELVPIRRNEPEIKKIQQLLPDLVLFGCVTNAYLESSYGTLRQLVRQGLHVICAAAACVRVGLLDGETGFTVIRLPGGSGHSRALFKKELLFAVTSSGETGRELKKKQETEASRYLIGICASTGGPKALLTVLKDLPPETGAVLLVQHLGKEFSRNFAEYLDGSCRMRVKLAEQGEMARDGTIYVAPGGFQLRVMKNKQGYLLRVRPEEARNGFCPSADCLFESMAEAAGENAMGIILTGMGDDGAAGLLKMRQAGAHTVGQDQETSDIYSMPWEAMARGGVKIQLPVSGIAGEILAFCGRMRKKGGSA